MYPPDLRPGYRLSQLKAVGFSASRRGPHNKMKTLILVLVLCLSSGACSPGGSSSGGGTDTSRGSSGNQGSGGQAGDTSVGEGGAGSSTSGGSGGVHVVCRCGNKPLGQKGETQAQAKARLKQMCENHFSGTLSACKVIP